MGIELLGQRKRLQYGISELRAAHPNWQTRLPSSPSSSPARSPRSVSTYPPTPSHPHTLTYPTISSRSPRSVSTYPPTPSLPHTLTYPTVSSPSHPHTLTQNTTHTLNLSHPCIDPHTLTLSHPHTLTPSHFHVLTPSHPPSLSPRAP